MASSAEHALRHPVSRRMLATLRRALAINGLDAESLIGDVDGAADAGGPRRAIDWSDLCAILERIEDACGGPDELRRFGRLIPEPASLRSLSRVFRFALTPAQLYRHLASWVGPAAFPATTASCEKSPDGRLRMVVEIAPDARDCPAFFHFCHGAVESAPRLLRLGASVVEAQIGPRRATYLISPPPSPSLLSRIGRVAELFRSSGATIDELAEQHARLREGIDALRSSEERFRRLAENADDMICEWDSRGRCVYVSPNVLHVLGIHPEEFIAHAWERLHPDDREAAARGLAGRVEEGGSGALEFRLQHANGGWRWFENSSNVVVTPAGDRHVVTVSRDVTERRELEFQLRQSQKMEALGRLAGGVAHDFNNLLTVIGGAGESLRDAFAAGSAEREDVDMILEATERAATLTWQLLAFGRGQPALPSTLELEPTLREMEEMLRRLIGANVALRVHVAPDLPPVGLDRGQLEQVILNLVVNARDAMPEGGNLVIEAREATLPPETDLVPGRASEPCPHVELSVSDEGVGMEPETLSRIFDPFFTTKEPGSGSGLGLATVYGIVDQAGGRLAVRSQPQKGTRILVFLPRSTAELDGIALEQPGQREPALGGGETILLVEDEENARSLIRRQLERVGYRVLDAANANDALATARAEPDPIDLLLTDVVMPGRSGPELAEILLRERSEMRTLFLSGYPGDALAGPLLDPERNLLQKPFRGEDLARRVREILDA